MDRVTSFSRCCRSTSALASTVNASQARTHITTSAALTLWNRMHDSHAYADNEREDADNHDATS